MSNCAPNLGNVLDPEQWEAPKRHVTKVYLHCSAASRASVDVYEVNRWHTEDNGWDCVGYHYFIKTDGTIQTGRDLERDPAAQSGHNTGTIAICLNGLHVADFTQAQYDAVFELCQKINETIDVTFHGHKEVAAKDCPVFDYVSVLNLAPDGSMPLYRASDWNQQTLDQMLFGLPANKARDVVFQKAAELKFWIDECRKAGSDDYP